MQDNNWQNRNDPNGASKEWMLIEKTMQRALDEQAKSRRWGIVFKALTFLYLFFVLIAFWNPGGIKADMPNRNKDHTALIDISGPIMDGSEANADSIVSGLRDAFEAKHSKAVLLRINSPGGSPVQSGFVYDEIKRLRKEYPEKKLYASITDIGASGAYYIASAADEIYADKASLVGSIGVISEGFGFTGIMDKVGIERRVITSGENKAFMDPFSPMSEKHKEFFKSVLGVVHQQFIDSVKNGRGDRLKVDKDTFSGLIWTGEQAIKIGLIDGLGSPGYVAREVVGYEDIVNYSISPSPVEQLLNRLGVTVVHAFIDGINTQSGLR